jgi:hypothetical protein
VETIVIFAVFLIIRLLISDPVDVAARVDALSINPDKWFPGS